MATRTARKPKTKKAASDEAAAFVERFIAAWAEPKVELLQELTHDGGLVRERITYMDSLPIVLGVLTRPSLWAAMARFSYLPQR